MPEGAAHSHPYVFSVRQAWHLIVKQAQRHFQCQFTVVTGGRDDGMGTVMLCPDRIMGMLCIVTMGGWIFCDGLPTGHPHTPLRSITS